MKPNIVAFIFARGGSKGVPRKNIRPLAGKPLIAYAIETGLASKLIRRVVVSTDDAEIAEVARRHGAEVPFMRPGELATDDAPERLAWQHAVRTLESFPGAAKLDVFVSVPTTSPLRRVEDVDACVRAVLDTDADMAITVTTAHRNPYFNMVTLDPNGYARLVMPPHEEVARRQDAQPVYDLTTVAYAARPEFVMSSRPWYEVRVRAVIVPPERAVDIDTELDFEIAEYLLSQRARGRVQP
ncbi:MAG: acylneuraminate cytidylyltransferase family protein [Verrucomicrobiota bacterium]